MTESAWMVRAGNNNELVDHFADNSYVAVGWPEIGDLSGQSSRDDIRHEYRDTYEKRKDGRVNTDSAQLYTFVNQIDDGDLVLTYDKDSREYLIGNVNGPYQYKPNVAPEGYPHIRMVSWNDKTLSRDDFSTPAQNTLGGASTVFSLDSCLGEIEDLRGGGTVSGPDAGPEGPPFIEEVESRSEELISDIVADIDPLDLEDLVAAVLRAMGYTAQTTSTGGDFGVDVVAHPDALGFKEPRIKAQVKHTKRSVGNENIGRFLGVLNSEEKGLYISTGGYTRQARTEALAHGQNITLMDRDDFIDLLLDHYHNLEQEYRAMIPLKQVYIPTEES